jgi:hypothetical protein
MHSVFRVFFWLIRMAVFAWLIRLAAISAQSGRSIGQALADCAVPKLKRNSSLIPMIAMLFPFILDAANKENHVGVVYTDSERWMLYRVHCFRTQDHQKHILPAECFNQGLKHQGLKHHGGPLAGWKKLANFWGLDPLPRNQKKFAAAVSINSEINIIA